MRDPGNNSIPHPRRRRLPLALAGAFAAAATSAHAVYLSPDGLGQALIYPYYTVQSAGGNSFNTYLSVVNTTTRAKAVKVRFREGKNGRQVLDFNLYLSPNDVWTASIGPQDSSSTSAPMLYTADKSCTSPPIPTTGVVFRNFNYVGSNADGGPTGIDRAREGYFEMIEMANLAGTAATAVTHNFSGTPANCAFVQPENGFRTNLVDTYLRPPNGGLMGTYTLINVSNGLNFAGTATALAELFAAPNFTENLTATPDLSSADPVAATYVPNSSGTGGLVGYRATYVNGRDAVSATLMRTTLVNEYALDSATRSATDWVLTFPTKLFYVAANGGTTATPFTGTFGATGACESFAGTFFDREESGGLYQRDFERPGDRVEACWTSQVLAFVPNLATKASSVLGSANVLPFPTNGYPNGWASVHFTTTNAQVTGLPSLAGAGTATDMAAGSSLSGSTLVPRGLPVIGFAARTLNNGLLSCTTFGGAAGTCVGSYGLLTDHRFTVLTTPTP